MRGYGGESENLGIVQLDEIKRHTLESTTTVGIYGGGPLKPASEWGVHLTYGTLKLEFTTGGSETRPVNTFVRYLIRAML